MDKKRLEKISEEALDEEQHAYNILTGEADNYVGADGARTVHQLCGYISELIETVKAQQAQLAAVPVDALKRQHSVTPMGTHDFELDVIKDKATGVLATVASFTAEYIQSRLLWQCGQMVPGADRNEALRYALQQLQADHAEGLRHTLEGQQWHTMARYGAGLIDADAYEMREVCQSMAEWLFGVPGSNNYTVPASWYDTPMGALWAMAIIRAEGDELITIAEAARLAGVTVQAISQRIERGALHAFVDPFAPERQGRHKVRRRDVKP